MKMSENANGKNTNSVGNADDIKFIYFFVACFCCLPHLIRFFLLKCWPKSEKFTEKNSNNKKTEMKMHAKREGSFSWANTWLQEILFVERKCCLTALAVVVAMMVLVNSGVGGKVSVYLIWIRLHKVQLTLSLEHLWVCL